MIVKSERTRHSLLSKLFGKQQILASGTPAVIASQKHFENELAKETCRVNRRGGESEFALLSFDFLGNEPSEQQLQRLADAFEQRLRISDTIGWHDLKLAVLLPETNEKGAIVVAGDLYELSQQLEIELKMAIAVFPSDNALTATAESLYQEASQKRRRIDFSDNDGGQHRIDQLHDGFRPSGGVGTLAAPKTMPESPANASMQGQVAAPSSAEVAVDDQLLFTHEKTPVWKRSIDIVGAGAGLVFLSPLLAAAAVAIKMNSPGPVFFIQQREGKDGKPFGIVKFRTMNVNAEAEQDALRDQSEQDGPAFKMKDDPRITPVGKYLRKSCVDELPQLFNVIAGQMSLVGPRPLPMKESRACEPWQRKRLNVLPGVTCIWQAHGGRDVKFEEWMRMDLEYIQKRSFWFDIKLIFETAFLALMHKGSV